MICRQRYKSLSPIWQWDWSRMLVDPTHLFLTPLSFPILKFPARSPPIPSSRGDCSPWGLNEHLVESFPIFFGQVGYSQPSPTILHAQASPLPESWLHPKGPAKPTAALLHYSPSFIPPRPHNPTCCSLDLYMPRNRWGIMTDCGKARLEVCALEIVAG